MMSSLLSESHGSSIQLREYQLASAKRVESEWKAGKKNVCLVMAMGGGKTSTCGWLIDKHLKENKGSRVLIVCHMRKLARQFADSVERSFGIPASLEMGGHRDEGYPILSATVQTIASGISKGRWRKDEFDLIVMDESHLSLSAQFQVVAKHFSGAKVLGPTATPHRATGEDLRSFFDGWVELPEARMDSLIMSGHLAPITIKKIPIRIHINHRGSGDVTDTECAHAIEPYLASAADSITRQSVNRCGFVFLPLIATSKRFVEMLRKRGVRAEHVDGGMEEADINAAIRRLERNEVDLLCNSQLMGIGVDVPCVDFVCILRPTSSWAVYCQQVGRGLRLFKGNKYRPKKEDCVLLDVIFETERHNLLQTPECLVTTDPEERELMKQKMYGEKSELELDLMKLKQMVTSARERSLQDRLKEAAAREAEVVSATDFLRIAPMTRDTIFPTVEPWEKDPPSAQQVSALQRLGFDLATVRNKGHAYSLMKEVLERSKKGLCSIDVGRRAKALGHSDPWSLTQMEAKQFIESVQPKEA